MSIASFASKKGGPGKTFGATTAAAYCSLFGPTLLIDATTQMDSTDRMVRKNNIEVRPENELQQVFRGLEVTPLNIGKNLDLIAGSKSLQEVKQEISKRNNRATIFKRWVRANKIRDFYKYVIVDSHNDFEVITQNMLIASDIVFGITGPSPDEIKGLADLMDDIDKNQKDPDYFDSNDEPELRADVYLVANRVKHNTNLSHELVNLMRESDNFVGAFPHREIAIEAAAQNATIFDLENQKKYQDESHRQYFKTMRETLENIRAVLDKYNDN